ncbi:MULTISPECIES: nicotinate-nucleotide--dimethylbenzimidazole phosphoribosyltransferase [Corynebacterium]|uniref:nicotinate-nucleotide--dimethylbenzimidazole phosphoribosyltransferase n=1 Tax=Corynebacterium TaxID=1716 RepID=UPI0018838E6F|nr:MULTISPECIES: nicotinate-nucleotide--dimethylbenzimidazole phosphoribosyltransferase [Corynebacterium]MBF0580748.1 nicotinate-nucleotide--dimethylbenzimidazole phosphoribosyltransferase [Corynebacterium sp. ED61]
MSDLPEFPAIVAPDAARRERATSHHVELPAGYALPAGSLGRLEQLGAWMAACAACSSSSGESSAESSSAESTRLIIVTGEHGIAAAHPEISTLPAELSSLVTEAIESGASPVASTARSLNVDVKLVDANSSTSSGEIDHEDALTVAQLAEYLQKGMDLADAEADQGTQLLAVGDAARGLTTVAATVIGSLCGIEPVKVVGWGSGIGDMAWRTKTAIIRDAMYRVRDDRADALQVLRRVGGADLAVLTGLLAQAAVRRTPVLIDGVGVLTAALCAQMIAPGSSDWWVVASKGNEPAITPALSALRLSPVLDAGISAGQGTGALLAVPLVRHAAEVFSG